MCRHHFQCRVVAIARDNLPVALNYHTARPNLQRFQQRAQGQAIGEFLLLAVNFNFHHNKKTAFAQTTRW